MTKISCNITDLNSMGDKIISTACELKNKAAKCKEDASNSLNKWTGKEKNTYSTKYYSKIDLIKKQADSMESFGKFLKKYASNVNELDINLSKINF